MTSSYSQILSDIKNLVIQGAENIALAGVEAIAIKLKETSDPQKLQQYYEEIRATRPTEPAMRNAVRFCLNNYQKNPNIISEVKKYFTDSKTKIAEYGTKKIEDGMTIFTHCHSSSVEAIILKAFQKGKKITVANTETRPRFQGRITAEKLATAGIEVHHYIDSAGHLGLKKADLFLFGCDALTAEGRIINKIGTAYLLAFANQYGIPAYSCTNSWKFDPETIYGAEEEIEIRDSKEIWENPPKNVIIHNPAFEAVNPDLVAGVISELGVFKPEAMSTQVLKAYPWMI